MENKGFKSPSSSTIKRFQSPYHQGFNKKKKRKENPSSLVDDKKGHDKEGRIKSPSGSYQKNLQKFPPPSGIRASQGRLAGKGVNPLVRLSFGCSFDAVADPRDDECSLVLSSRCFLATEADPLDDILVRL
ncbi:unnamed protein product [Sphenostylis stenocarpa]|uniref:Uncharacterized protein n=1 Tax=Sphenostylis stenocarpa TaxID=92480 RepID=A0AA86SG80_9FABA|nr:unnamed protein product [Sphenostylis stenocarpa]